jgi:hypothetical protein
MNTPQTTLRIPSGMKTEFQQLCKEKHTTMTTEVIRFIGDYIYKETGRKEKIQSLGNDLIQHPVTKTWMTKNEYNRGLNL